MAEPRLGMLSAPQGATGRWLQAVCRCHLSLASDLKTEAWRVKMSDLSHVPAGQACCPECDFGAFAERPGALTHGDTGPAHGPDRCPV